MSPEARERSFDELARGLANDRLSRGRMLRLMGAALLGGTLTSFGFGGIAAAQDQNDQGQNEECKPLNQKCRRNTQCCSGNCAGGKCAAACTANGGSCSINSECCSGRCGALGTCDPR